VLSTAEKVAKIAGSGLEVSDTVDAVAVAHKIGVAMDKGEVDTENLQDYISNNLSADQRKSVQGLVSGKSGKEAKEALEGVSRRASSQGLSAAMVLAESKLSGFEKGSEKFTLGSAAESFRNARSRGGKLQAVMEELTHRNKELTGTAVNLNSGAGLIDFSRMTQSQVEAHKGLTGASNVDIGKYQGEMKSLEVGQFNSAVTEFAKAVNKFSGKPDTSSQTTVSGQPESVKAPSLYDRLSNFQNNLRTQGR